MPLRYAPSLLRNVACAKSQSQLLQELDNVKNDARKAQQCVRYLQALAGQSIIELYSRGDISLVLDIALKRNGNKESTASWVVSQERKLTSAEVALLVFHLNVAKRGDLHQWNEKLMLVDEIKAVNGPNIIIPSRVWLYVGNYPFIECGSGGVYLSCLKRIFKARDVGENRKLGELSKLDIEPREHGNPSKIQGGPEIVNCIAHDQGEIFLEGLDLRKGMLDEFLAGTQIHLDSGHISVWQRDDTAFDIRDVLIGPFDF
jgi:hypothetical protein